jgi:hypothetical protein
MLSGPPPGGGEKRLVDHVPLLLERAVGKNSIMFCGQSVQSGCCKDVPNVFRTHVALLLLPKRR